MWPGSSVDFVSILEESGPGSPIFLNVPFLVSSGVPKDLMYREGNFVIGPYHQLDGKSSIQCTSLLSSH